MLVLVDLDGVLADLDAAFYDEWVRRHPGLAVPSGCEHIRKVRDRFPRHLQTLADEIVHAPGFYLTFPPVAGGKEAMRALRELGHDTRICSSPHMGNPTCEADKREWLSRHLGVDFAERAAIVRDKTAVGGDILIDDKPEVTGAARPSWEHVLYDRPYNRDVRGKRRLTWADWREVLFGS